MSINRYKEIMYEKVEYDPPATIMDRLDKLNAEITLKLQELRRMLVE